MPGFDGTGPRGLGSMAGAGMGYCVLDVSRETDASCEAEADTEAKYRQSLTNVRSKIMPAGDRTGPAGMGPMTGRGLGDCVVAGGVVAGARNFIGRGFGAFGFGGGRGRGRGWRNGFLATGMTGRQRAGMDVAGSGQPYGQAAPTREQELSALKGQAEEFGNALTEIKQRIDELQGQADDKA